MKSRGSRRCRTASRFFESKIDVSMTIETLRYYAGWADKLAGETVPVDGPYFTYMRREPVGVVGAIVPWNFPLNIAGWKFSPALAAGCTVVLKPATETPLTALAMAEIMREAGLPAGGIQRGAGRGLHRRRGAGPASRVDKISFTGSTEVGKRIMKDAADTVKRVTLELGGKSPNLVFADADLGAAVRGAQNGIFYGKGEVCAAGSRLLVERKVKDQVVEQLAERAKKLVPGDPFDKNTRLGAVVSKRQQETVHGLHRQGEIRRRECGGRRQRRAGERQGLLRRGHHLRRREARDDDLARRDLRARCSPCSAFDDVEEAVHLANQSMYGLAAGIWTRDISKAHRVAHAIRAGTVWINTYNIYDPAASFRWLQAIGLRPRPGPDGARGVHRDQDGVGGL